MVKFLSQFFLLSALLLGLLLAPAESRAENEDDSWALRQGPNAKVEDMVERWCEIGGTHVRYANFPIPGYQPCGSLGAQRTCDSQGKRFIGAGSAPYAYLDCSRGPRVQVTQSRQTEEFRDSSPSDADTANGFKSLENQRKALDALLDSPHSRGSGRGATHGSGPGGRPLIDMSSIGELLRVVQDRSQEMQQLLNEQ